MSEREFCDLDVDRPCFALFEGRAELGPNGRPLELTPDLAPLRQVCDEFGLRMVTR